MPPVPQEAAVEVTVQLDMLYEIAKLQKVFGVENSKLAIDQAKDYIVKKNYGQAYYIGRGQLDKLVFDAAPYIWLEGENDCFWQATTRFSMNWPDIPKPVEAPICACPPPIAPCLSMATRRVMSSRPRMKEFIRYGWREHCPARTHHLSNGASIMTQTKTLPTQHPHGPLYMNERFGWVLLGTAKLGKGDQKLTIDVTDPAAASHEYTFAIDALMITDKTFAPNGTIKPIPVDDISARDYKKEFGKRNPKPHYAPP